MAHEVEQMFSVNETPWHKLGRVVTKAPTIEEAIKLAGLDWSVGLKKLLTEQGQNVPAVATVRNDTDKVLGVVGTSYKPLQNAEAFKFFEPFLASKEATLETAGSLRDGQRVWVLAKLNREDSVIVPQSDDRVSKFLLLSNSHDGTMAVRVGFTPIRVVCANTLAMSHSDSASKLIRIRHKGNVVDTLQRVQEIINLANNQFEATAEQYRALAKKTINFKDLEKFVRITFNLQDAEEAQRTSKVLEAVVPLFEHGRGNDMPGVRGTMWAAYNAVTEYLQYERGNGSEDKRLDSTWFGQSAAINKKALETAAEMVAA